MTSLIENPIDLPNGVPAVSIPEGDDTHLPIVGPTLKAIGVTVKLNMGI